MPVYHYFSDPHCERRLVDGDAEYLCNPVCWIISIATTLEISLLTKSAKYIKAHNDPYIHKLQMYLAYLLKIKAHVD